MKKIVLFVCFLAHACSYAGPKVVPFDPQLTISAIFNNDQKIVDDQLKHLIIRYTKLSGTKNPTIIKDALLKEHVVPQIQHKKLKEDDTFNLIMIAAFTGKVAILRSIVNAIPIPEESDHTKSERLNKKQNDKVRREYMSEYLNRQNNHGRTALMLAELSRNNETVQYLVSQEPDISRVDFYGHGFYWYLPAHLLVDAIVANDQDAITLYLFPPTFPRKCNRLVINQQINTEFERPIDERITSLMAIAAKIPESQTEEEKIYFIDLAKLLISRIDIKKENNYHRTALQYAIAANNTPITELLVDKEAELLKPQRDEIPPEHVLVATAESDSSPIVSHNSDDSQ
jgi:ankyrin repeat protein